MNLNDITVVGLDVHKDSITFAVLYPGREGIADGGRFENSSAALARLAKRVGTRGAAEFVYEAGPCGYEVHRLLTHLGQRCVVVAPGLIPVRPTDRVKTDRRDAEKLARLHRAGELTAVRVPERWEEASRDLTRAREDILVDRLRARHRLSKFLLRNGLVWRESKAWGLAHLNWVRGLKLGCPAHEQTLDSYRAALYDIDERLRRLDGHIEELARQEPYATPVRYLRCLRGVDTLSALTMIAEVQEFKRFPDAPALMAFTGLVSSEYSSGASVHRGRITKAGSPHLRRVLVESAWAYRGAYRPSPTVAKRRVGCPDEVVRIAVSAEKRLGRKYGRMVARGKKHQVAVTAVARELAGFVWAVSRHFPERPLAHA